MTPPIDVHRGHVDEMSAAGLKPDVRPIPALEAS